MERNGLLVFHKVLLWSVIISLSLVWGITAVFAAEVTLTGLSIKGVNRVNENSSYSYAAVARYSDGTSRTVTAKASWSENSAYATISKGALTTGSVNGNQTATIKARFSYAGVTRRASRSVTIVDVPSSKSLTGLTVSGATSVNEGTLSPYTATAAFSDGSTQEVTSSAAWSLDGTSWANISSGGMLAAKEVAGNQTVAVMASYAKDGVSRSDDMAVGIVDVTPPVTGSHAGRFTSFDGTKTCLQCHTNEANQVHASAHYQWKGDSSDIVNGDGQPAGKLGGINDFCIYPDINWIGKLTTVDNQTVDGGCARCHVGLGSKPQPTVSQNQLENIDCLICHAPNYKRTVELVNGAYQFVPDTTKMTVSLLQAASDIRPPSKDTCLNCHTKAGGGDNFKRGDIEEAHRSASREFDVHLASKGNGGAGLECLSCHTVSAHRIAGRGSDLRERDSQSQVACSNCHSTSPHGDTKIDKHTARVNCTVCHIPNFAKAAPTDMDRDWSLPGEVDPQKQLYDPAMEKVLNVKPEYRFFNGTSTFYQFGDAAMPDASGRITMSAPVGDVQTAGSKIHAFKHHLGTQPIDPVTNQLLPLKIGIYFQNGDINTAVQKGVEGVGWPYHGFNYALTERYMGIFHEVAPKDQALSCNSCHNGGARLDFASLGYTPKSTRNGKPLCASCHDSKSAGFDSIHDKHVADKKYDCSTCHGFSKAQ
jgi:hypothetical protein